jgi:DNA-binding NtrC family response regulator
VAKTEATVLITGETGTGKELLARLIHSASPRAAGPCLSVNCAALPESLIEAELFGHERGAFTGAAARRAGRFEAASGGTLVLDEVSELPLAIQPKLLRALQEREVVRVGSNQPVRVNVRIVALTNRDLAAEVRAGRFREDLYYRLNVVSLRLPPLRERRGDIPLLAHHFLDRYRLAHASAARGFSPQALNLLLAHRWPGNVRELENVVQRALILCPGPEIGPEHLELEPLLAPAPAPGLTVQEMERQLILSTLERLNGNRTHTARALGLSVRTIRNRLRRYRMEAQAHLGSGPAAGESA